MHKQYCVTACKRNNRICLFTFHLFMYTLIISPIQETEPMKLPPPPLPPLVWFSAGEKVGEGGRPPTPPTSKLFSLIRVKLNHNGARHIKSHSTHANSQHAFSCAQARLLMTIFLLLLYNFSLDYIGKGILTWAFGELIGLQKLPRQNQEKTRDLIPNNGENVQKPGKHGESRAPAIPLWIQDPFVQ